MTELRAMRQVPVRLRAARVLDWLLGDWWAPSRRVAVGVLVLIIGLLTIIGLTLGPAAAGLVVGALVVMRLACRCP